MRKTNVIQSGKKITVDIVELQAMLSCGRNTAASIGDQAGAVIRVGRRKLYNIEKVQAYMNKLSEV